MNNCMYCGKEIETSSCYCRNCQDKINKIGFLLQSLNADEKTVQETYEITEKTLYNNLSDV